MKINPMRLPGPCADGYVLDYHSVSATPLGNDQFDMNYNELGHRVYRFKYRSDRSVFPDLADTAEDFVRQRGWILECVVPAPASFSRTSQPVSELGRELGIRLNLTLCENAVVKVKRTPSMKNVRNPADRQRLLAEAIQAGAEAAARSLASDSVAPKTRQKTAQGSTPSEAKEAHS